MSPDIAAYGAAGVKTPNLDRLAAAKNAFTLMETLKTSKTLKTNTLDRERTNRVSLGKNVRAGGHPAQNPAPRNGASAVAR